VLVQLRTHLDLETLHAIQTAAAGQGLTFTGAFLADRCVGIAGWRVMDTTSVIRKLYVDDLVTDAEHRSLGIGRALLDHLTERARLLDCPAVTLDSGVQRLDAHRFYRREGFEEDTLHFRRHVPR
jgi:GNAT superfamily N-acetyltransferase